MTAIELQVEGLLGRLAAGPEPLLTPRGRQTLPPKEARYAASERLKLAAALAPPLYTHQARAIDLVLAGENVVLATGTASGKTLAFALPALEQTLACGRTTLLIYPTKALMNDQRRMLLELALKAGLPRSAVPPPFSAIETEDRKAVKDGDTRFLIMTPESLDQSLLCHHKGWGRFLMNLGLVVLDEVHYYKGYFGINIAYLLRRLRQVQSYYSRRPTVWLASSATVGHPGRTAQTLTGLPFREVGGVDDGAPVREKTIFFAEAAPGHFLDASVALTGELAKIAAKEGAGGVVNFMASRQMVERAILKARERFKGLGEAIASYRSGYGEREKLEEDLRAGALRAVFSTNALEAGIDYGSLAVAVMTGLPGTASEMTQRSGRVGRQSEGAVILLGGESPFDRYYLDHPKEYLARLAEPPPLALENDLVAARHYSCAKMESRVFATPLDFSLFPPNFKAVAAWPEQTEGGEEDPVAAVLDYEDPYRRMQLRTFSGREAALRAGGYEIGTIETRARLNEAYPGGIYLHNGKRYRVSDGGKYGAADWLGSTIELEPLKPPWTTKPVRRFGINRKKELAGKGTAKLLNVVAYQQVLGFTETGPGRAKSVLYPEPIFWSIRSLAVAIEPRGAGPEARHALEHLMRSVVPLRTPFEDSDFGACCDAQAVYVYDAVPGGAGLAQTVFKRLKACLRASIEILESCRCKRDAGCPLCLHAERCERENDALSKSQGLAAARKLWECLPEDAPEPLVKEDAEIVAPVPSVPVAMGNLCYSVGSRVRHPAFGEGAVVARRGERHTFAFVSGEKIIVPSKCAARIELLSGFEGRLCPSGCGEELLPRDVPRCPRCTRSISDQL